MTHSTPKQSKADLLYQKLKKKELLDEFCDQSGTTSDNLRQIIYHGGSISKRLATQLSQTSRLMFGERGRLKPSDFLFPNGEM